MTTPQPEPRVSDEDRSAAIAKICETPCVYGEDWDSADLAAPVQREAAMIVDALISHGWGPTPELRDDRDQLAKALLTVLYDLHPVGGSTSRTGIGGAAVTMFCDIAHPINVAAEQLRDKVEGVLRYHLRRMEREGRNHKDVDLREVTE